ncbi:hypothetical protein [Catenulispora subtropica]|uniref:Uncharacterized protein n=1 Tax=Catenulispora subtropica TaxID=450798 RepID=A0ABN2T938_9ACTN
MIETEWPRWMADCPGCAALITAVTQATAARPHGEIEAVRDHLVDAHLARIPDYVEDCANCQEWRALAASPEGLKPKIVPVLGREGPAAPCRSPVPALRPLRLTDGASASPASR